MAWNWHLISADQKLAVDLNAGGNGSLSGTIIFNGEKVVVSGGWSSAGSVAGRVYSAFSFSGRTNPPSDVPMWIAASGTMTGQGDTPTGIDIRVTTSSSADGAQQTYGATLSPNRTPYLVTQAQLMQDWIAHPTERDNFLEINGYRVIVASKDFNGNPLPTKLRFSFTRPGDTGDLHFTDGIKRTIAPGTSIDVDTNHDGELSFVIDSQGQLSCPPVRVSATFMAPGHGLIVSPDRHVHAMLANLTGDQLRGKDPLKSGKTATLATSTGGPIDAIAEAIRQTMSACIEHTLRPDRPITRDAGSPEDIRVRSYFPSYQRLLEPYHFASNTIATHFIEHDVPVTRIAIPENMPNSQWSLDFTTNTFTKAADPNAPAHQATRNEDPLSALFNGQASIRVSSADYLAAVISSDSAARQRSADGLWDRIKDATHVSVTTAEAFLDDSATAIKHIWVKAYNDKTSLLDHLVHSLEDAMGLVGALFAKIGAELHKVIDFLKEIFDFDDIGRSADILESLIRQAPGVIGTVIGATQGVFDNEIDNLRNNIATRLDKDIAQLGPKGTMNAQTAPYKGEPPGNIHSKYFTSHFSANIRNTDFSGVLDLAVQSDFSNKWSTLFNATSMQPTLAKLRARPPRFLLENMLDSALASILNELKEVLYEFLTLLKSGVDSVFKFVEEIVKAILELATVRIPIPFLANFYEKIVRPGKKFNFLGISCLASAVGFNAVYKLFIRRPGNVFSDLEAANVSSNANFLNQMRISNIVRTTPISGTDRKVLDAFGYVFGVGTFLWGACAAWEDARWTPGQEFTSKLHPSTGGKIAFQVVTLIASTVLVVMTPNNSNVKMAAIINTVVDYLQLASNVAAAKSAAWAELDPFLTALAGLCQLGASIAMAVMPGGTSALDTASNILQSFEWIPQAAKILPELAPETIGGVQIAVVASDIASYVLVSALAIIGTSVNMSSARS